MQSLLVTGRTTDIAGMKGSDDQEFPFCTYGIQVDPHRKLAAILALADDPRPVGADRVVDAAAVKKLYGYLKGGSPKDQALRQAGVQVGAGYPGRIVEHGPHAGNGRAVFSRLCASCHRAIVNKQNRFNHMPVREGKMSCASCHIDGDTDGLLLGHLGFDDPVDCGGGFWREPALLGGAPERAALEQRVAQNEDDLESRDLLAARLALAGDAEGALEQYLEILRRDRRYRDDYHGYYGHERGYRPVYREVEVYRPRYREVVAQAGDAQRKHQPYRLAAQQRDQCERRQGMADDEHARGPHRSAKRPLPGHRLGQRGPDV